MKSEGKVWSVTEVLRRVPELGIPHFQRGQVWGTESRSALLESLFFDTPCGSFVLWKPDQCASRGVPLDPAKCKDMSYLVVDGQQRIRSLHAVFSKAIDREDGSDDAEGQSAASGDGGAVWCINLAQVPWYVPHLKAPERDFALFVHTKDPAARQAENLPSPLKYNMLPLHVVLDEGSWTSDNLKPYRDLLRPNSQSGAAPTVDWPTLYGKLHETVCAMKEREFFISVQRSNDLAEMANLYNRINAGGKRVDVEERAFARLVGLQPSTYDELARVFDAVHGRASTDAADKQGARLDRDEVLERQKERAFGFKLFIRVFLQVCSHHLGYRQSRGDFSFDLTNRGRFLASLKGLDQQQSAQLWTEARSVLMHVRGVLREELRCDDLRFLPETQSLTPVFQLLIIYPRLREPRYRQLLANLCLRLMLAELDSRTLTRLLDHAADRGRVAFDVIPAIIETLNDAGRKSAKLAARLQQANSIQHRFVLMLYWLERHLGAVDFLYGNVSNKNRPAPPELPIGEAAEPEKQHLLPFKKAQALYRDELRRGDSHIVNSIGNLTYISQTLNSFETGLGDDFAKLPSEPEDNQRAHVLVDGGPDKRVLIQYEKLMGLFDAEGLPRSDSAAAKARKVFERMARYRCDLIATQFLEWQRKMEADALSALGQSDLDGLKSLANIDDRLEPESPWFAPIKDQHAIDVIRKLRLSNADEDRMIVLARNAARVPPNKEHKLERDFWLTKRKKRVWVNAAPERITLCFAPAVSIEHRGQILEALGLDRSMSPIPNSLPLNPVPDFRRLLDLVEKLGPKLEEAGAAT